MIDNIFGTLDDPSERLARAKESLEGVRHLQRRAPLDPLPGQPLHLYLTTGGSEPFDAARCFFSLDGSDPLPTSAQFLELAPGAVEWQDLVWGYLRTWTAAVPAQPVGTLLRYRLAAHQAQTGEWIFADNQAAVPARADQFALWIDHDPVPDWSRQALVYHVFVDRFYPGDGKPWNPTPDVRGFYGGTLRGVIDKLDYIQGLGFNTIWLSPFFVSDSHHGYNASDYYTVEPRLGTNADLQELIEKAHARGMRMLLDFVANHWSSRHPSFQAAQRDQDSPYHDWYIWKDWPKEYESYFTVRELPKLNLKPGPAREYLLEVARHWLRQGFDGYRLDFAYGPSHDFWVDFRRACREVKPDAWLFGEVVHTAAVQRSYAGIMDGTLDFLLAQALRETFASGSLTLSEFEAFLSAHEAYFPADFSRPAFLDNHDMTRFLYLAGDDTARLKLAALVLYTLAGAPIVYNGTEAGVSQQRPLFQGGHNIFEEARLPVRWGAAADAGLLEHFRRLGALRRAHPALWSGTRRLLHLDSPAGTYVYLRQSQDDAVLVAINAGTQTRRLHLPVRIPGPVRDRLNATHLEVRADRIDLELPPLSGAFLSNE